MRPCYVCLLNKTCQFQCEPEDRLCTSFIDRSNVSIGNEDDMILPEDTVKESI